MKMELCQMKIKNGETQRYIADLKQEADKKKNGVGVGTLGVFYCLVVGVLAYLFVSGLLARGYTWLDFTNALGMLLCCFYSNCVMDNWTICACDR